jgi:hypothetical protein
MQGSSPPRRVREPVQVYLAPDDRDLLQRLAEESGLSQAEILRRGIRSYAATQQAPSPMLRFLEEGATGVWPGSVAERHDEVLVGAYRPRRRKSR